MKIFVTEEDIKKGIKMSHTACPIALSLRRRKIHFEEINEGAIITDGYDDDRSEEGKIDLPPEALDFITNFDIGNRVGPFSFNVKI